jgi:hypothetical protein
MTKQRPSITSTVMVLDPLIYKLGDAIETCTPFEDRVPGELSANRKLSRTGLWEIGIVSARFRIETTGLGLESRRVHHSGLFPLIPVIRFLRNLGQ